MKITASIGVIDEIECLERCVNHHESIGIDSFVITDLGSTDGTKDVLNRLCRRQNVRILEAGQNLTESEWPRAMQEFAYECFKPEYIVYIDPDEFWLPLSGSLSRYREFDVISARRYNVIPDARLAAGDWRTQEPPGQRIVFRERISYAGYRQLDHRTPIVRYAPAPKIMHRAVPAAIAPGWHGVQSERLQTTISPEDLLIVHFPLSTYDRFLRKVTNAAKYLDENRDRLGPDEAWHWRILVASYRAGTLRETYDGQIFSEEIALFVQQRMACPAGELLAE